MSLEPEDLTGLYERTARPLLVFFQRRVDDPEVAVDLMADCFTIALERRTLTDKEIERIEELAASQSIREAVVRSLDRLPEDQREAVRLRIVEGLPYADVASRLGLTPSGTRTRVTRAMRTLRGMLEGEGEEVP
jgi:RNA polymerase sigma-70 factor (ECF subfamily)